LVTESETPFAIFSSLTTYIDYMAKVIERVNGKLDKWNVANANNSKIDPTVNAYIIDWLYGENDLQVNFASNTNTKLNSNGYYDKLKLKVKDATNSIKAINPKAFEVEVVSLVKTNNSISNVKKVNTIEEGCVYTYKSPNVITNMPIGRLDVPYNIKNVYSSKKIEELFFTENVVKNIEDVLIKLYNFCAPRAKSLKTPCVSNCVSMIGLGLFWDVIDNNSVLTPKSILDVLSEYPPVCSVDNCSDNSRFIP
jgi:hypothetical protein